MSFARSLVRGCAWALLVSMSVAAAPQVVFAVACGDSVSGNTNLATSLTNCPGTGLTVTANNVTITCNPGVEIDGNASGSSNSDTGIIASGRSNVVVDGCIIKDFYRGIQYTSGTGGAITDSSFSNNALYAIDLVQTTGVAIDGNTVTTSGDEGIHVTGKSGGSCPSPHPGNNVIVRNTVTSTAGEGIYILCSDSNRIEDNILEDNAAVGVNIDESSSFNLVSGNTLTNDGVQVKASSNNTVIANTLIDEVFATSPPARLFFDNADSNYAENNSVDADNAADQCYNFQDGANCNQLVRSSCVDPDVANITSSGATQSINNRFFEFTRDTPTLCSLTTNSTVDVYNATDTFIGCGGSPAVVPGNCTWWAFDPVCDDGTTNSLGDTQANAASWDLNSTTINDTQYYRANSTTVRLSVSGPLVVSSTGCLSVSAATAVELHPGTNIAGRFHAVVM